MLASLDFLLLLLIAIRKQFSTGRHCPYHVNIQLQWHKAVMVFSYWGFHGGSDSKESACNAGDLGSIPGLGRHPGEENSNHSSILAWKIPWTREPGELQSPGLQGVRHDWATHTFHFPDWYMLVHTFSLLHTILWLDHYLFISPPNDEHLYYFKFLMMKITFQWTFLWIYHWACLFVCLFFAMVC